jgi:hypothetical protein
MYCPARNLKKILLLSSLKNKAYKKTLEKNIILIKCFDTLINDLKNIFYILCVCI